MHLSAKGGKGGASGGAGREAREGSKGGATHVGLADEGRDLAGQLGPRDQARPEQDGGLGRLVERERVEVEPLGRVGGGEGRDMGADGGDGGAAEKIGGGGREGDRGSARRRFGSELEEGRRTSPRCLPSDGHLELTDGRPVKRTHISAWLRGSRGWAKAVAVDVEGAIVRGAARAGSWREGWWVGGGDGASWP